MNILSDEEVKKLMVQITDILKEEVFGVIYDYLEFHPEKRSEINSAFPFPKQIKFGILGQYFVVEYCGPEEKNNDLISIQGQHTPRANIEDFLQIDLSHVFTNRFAFNEPIENMSFFLGDSIQYLTDYFYDMINIPTEITFMNAIIDLDKIEKYTFISNSTIFWTDKNGNLKIRRIDFLEIFPLPERGIEYWNEDNISRLTKILLENKVPKYNIQLHKVLNEFIELINLAETNETNITKYMEKYPAILQYAFGINNLNPQVLLEWQYETDCNNLKPDFFQ